MTQFAVIDWAVLVGYLALIAGFGVMISRQGAATTGDFFRGGNQVSVILVTVSVLATTQSAATFLGGPDAGYRGDYTYLGTFLGSLAAALFVSRVLIPRFYAIDATTVYELLGAKYGVSATRAAGAMYMLGRIFANGARLYMAAIAVSMILFGNIAAMNVVMAAAIITALGFGFTFVGGIRSVIWSDLLQFVVYGGAALGVLIYLYVQIPASLPEIWAALETTPEGENKLRLFDFRLDFANPFSIYAVMTGLFLLGVGNAGLDQDTTQRLLTTKDAKSGGRALVLSAMMAVPVVWVFVTIGQLLYIFYQRPDLMTTPAGAPPAEFSGQAITVFMAYILSEIPAGLKGLVTAGVVAAAISTLNSGLNSMSSVLVKDFYEPWKQGRGGASQHHYVTAGRIGMALFAAALFAMSVLCYYWQQVADTPLLVFALSVMIFAYAGLLGVFFVAVFTNRGSAASVIAALVTGFCVVLAFEVYFAVQASQDGAARWLAFPWVLVVGVIISAAACALGRPTSRAEPLA